MEENFRVNFMCIHNKKNHMKFMNKMSSLICLSLICVLLFLQIFFLISQTWVYKIVTVGMHPPIHTAVVFLTKQFLHYFYDTYVYFFQYYSGSKSLNPVRRPPLCPSMHRSQWSIGQNMADTTFDTEYSKTYFEKDIIPVSICS